MTPDERYEYNKTWRNDHRERVNELSRKHFKQNKKRSKSNALTVGRLKVRYPDIYKELILV